MRELHQIRDLETARVLLNPVRISLLRLLREPNTCTGLARTLEMSPQRVNNHVKELLAAGLVELVGQQTKRNLVEGVYQSVARSFWLSPALAGEARCQEEQASLNNLLIMAERLQEDVVALLDCAACEPVPSIGATIEVRLRDASERDRFARDFLETMNQLLARYQGGTEEDHRYTAMWVCYPSVRETL